MNLCRAPGMGTCCWGSNQAVGRGGDGWGTWEYLEGEVFDFHHLPKPAQGSIDELQHGQESNEVGCNVGHESYGGGSPIAGSFQDVPLFPGRKETLTGSRCQSLQTSLRGLQNLCHLQCPNCTHSCPVPPLCSHSPTADTNAFFALELGLFHFRVDQFGHGKGTGCSHHRCCNQQCRIYLQQADCGLRPCMRLPKHIASNAWSNPGHSAHSEWEGVPVFPILATEDAGGSSSG